MTLKFVFDYLRNVGLSALLFALGIVILKGDPIRSLLSIPWSEVVLGFIVCAAAFILAVLNFTQGILAILAAKKLSMPIYLLTSLVIQAASFEVFFRQVFRLVNT